MTGAGASPRRPATRPVTIRRMPVASDAPAHAVLPDTSICATDAISRSAGIGRPSR